jgi:hypothetical protein
MRYGFDCLDCEIHIVSNVALTIVRQLIVRVNEGPRISVPIATEDVRRTNAANILQ